MGDLNSVLKCDRIEILRSLANSERLTGDGEKGDPPIADMNYKRHKPARRKWRSAHRRGYCSEGKQKIFDSIDKGHKKEINVNLSKCLNSFFINLSINPSLERVGISSSSLV